MKRDWNVIRLILVTMEENPSASFQLYPSDFPPVDPQTVSYHLQLLKQGGYVQGIHRNLVGVPPGEDFIATGLTLQGHDLADTLKSKTVWARILETSRLKGIELTADAVKMLAEHAVKSMLSSLLSGLTCLGEAEIQHLRGLPADFAWCRLEVRSH